MSPWGLSLTGDVACVLCPRGVSVALPSALPASRVWKCPPPHRAECATRLCQLVSRRSPDAPRSRPGLALPSRASTGTCARSPGRCLLSRRLGACFSDFPGSSGLGPLLGGARVSVTAWQSSPPPAPPFVSHLRFRSSLRLKLVVAADLHEEPASGADHLPFPWSLLVYLCSGPGHFLPFSSATSAVATANATRQPGWGSVRGPHGSARCLSAGLARADGSLARASLAAKS